MKLHFAPLTVAQFLADYWQQRPVVIKDGLTNFNNPLEPDELAGLAAEYHIESRLIYRQDGNWLADSGPFDNYDRYGKTDWTLVVQSVNHWIPEVQAFARLFDFIPQWRFDDVMVSFAAPNGGVGPHVDNYDVFICQGSGQRRWRVGDPSADFDSVIAHEKLLHVSEFEAVIDEVLSAGDILYIPPGCPHEGVSLDNSMSFSVGYKATNATELLSGFADYLIDYHKQPALLKDFPRNLSDYGQIASNDCARLQQLLFDTIANQEKLQDFLGIYLSQSRSELDVAVDEYDFASWQAQFADMPLYKLYAVKMLYLDGSIEEGIFYVDGERHQLNAPTEQLKMLCNAAVLTQQDIDDEAILQWLWQSTNRGYWFFEE